MFFGGKYKIEFKQDMLCSLGLFNHMNHGQKTATSSDYKLKTKYAKNLAYYEQFRSFSLLKSLLN